jgi:hypothetical protein
MSPQPSRFISYRSEDDDYYLIVRVIDPISDGQLRTLAHLSGGCKLDSHTFRFPYMVICRLAGRQQRGERFGPGVDGTFEVKEEIEAVVEGTADRLCPCGKALTGQASQRYCSPRCRQQACRANPEGLAQRKEFRSVTNSVTGVA